MHILNPSKFEISLGGVLRVLVLSGVVIAGPYYTQTVNKDVVILGGGAGGSYAAVRLREDYGKSVLLVEKESILGGHTNTYKLPSTGEAFNYGVQSYVDYFGAKAFFKRFSIPLQESVEYDSNTLTVDANTGKSVPNAAGGAPGLGSPLSIAALQRYYKVILPWNDILLPGYWNFPSGDKIPADLLLPFADFVKKYDLADMASAVSIISGQDINTRDLTLFVVKNFGSTIIEGFLNNTFFDPVPFDNSILYGNITRLLGNDVMLSSSLIEADRTDHGITLVIQDLLTGKKTQVTTKRLLVAAEPSVDNLAVLGLDAQENAVLNTWSNGPGSVYTAVLKTNLVPDNTSVSFVTPTNAARKPYNFSIMWNGASQYFWIIFGSQKKMNDKEAKDTILAQTQVLADGGFLPIGSSIPSSEVVAISNHTSVVWGQDAEQIKAGFVKDLYALQGRHNTWYTGGLWCPDYSSHVWAFTDTVLVKLLEGIA